MKWGYFIVELIFFKRRLSVPFHKEGGDRGVFLARGAAGGGPNASQIPKQKTKESRSVKQRAFESICAELNRPAGKGILQGKGSRLLYDCADVNGIIQILAECLLPAF